MQKSIVFVVLATLNFIFSTAVVAKKPQDKPEETPFVSTCINNPKLQQARSLELKKLVAADQKCRTSKNGEMADANKIDWSKVTKQDLARRKRVGEIFGEGCLKSPEDYLAAALIYQHGDVPDHYYQTYIWANHAAELGEKEAKSLAAKAIDRYLVHIGKKQLFGTQYSSTSPKDWCYCMSQVEPSFPDDLRKEYLGQPLDEYSRDHFAMFNKGKNCPNVECSKNLKPTPKGTVPGLW
ncbi:MAG: hypothetical protein ACD_21C00240G0002 [uncultured bacterium]|nr:MAG: hypothetical protein ACD_21C00240G0002 [uncultured bacterium]